MVIPSPASNATSVGTLRAQIKILCMLLACLIVKRNVEYARGSDWRHVPMGLLISKLGQPEDSGRMLHLKILHGLSGMVHNVDVHYGFGVVAS